MFRKTVFLLAKNQAVEEARRRASNVGFIGLGNMGGYMATNLLAKTFELTISAITFFLQTGTKGN